MIKLSLLRNLKNYSTIKRNSQGMCKVSRQNIRQKCAEIMNLQEIASSKINAPLLTARKNSTRNLIYLRIIRLASVSASMKNYTVLTAQGANSGIRSNQV